MRELKTCLMVSAVALLAVTGCERPEPGAETEEVAVAPVEIEAEPMVAVATLEPGEGSEVSGTVSFTQTGDEVSMIADIMGAEPGMRGLHLHGIGDCSAPDHSSAGDHFNPTGAPHGCPPPMMAGGDVMEPAMAEGAEDTMAAEETMPETMDAMADGHHAGDFGNIEIGEEGSGHLELTTDMLTVEPGPNSVVGKAVIFHGGQDDCTTQPSGNSGDRIACGVVQLAEAEFGGEAMTTETMPPGEMGETTEGGTSGGQQ